MRDAGMRVVIESLAGAMPSVANILAIVLALQTVFAIVGMRLFLGSFASCSDEAIHERAACVGFEDALGPDGEPLPREWENPWVGNFDSWPASMMALFQAQTGDTLPDLIFAGMDVVGVDLPPRRVEGDWVRGHSGPDAEASRRHLRAR